MFFYYEINRTGKDIINDKNRLNDLYIVSEEKNIEAADLKETIDDLDDLDRKIEEIKEDYFRKAVRAEEMARNGEAGFKVCYLTFDDGPYRDTTPAFLDILEEKDVLATFFCLKKEGDDDIYLREKINCHTIGNHTASHDLKYIYGSIDNFIDDLLENRSFIEEKLGITTEVMRFPGGSPQVTYMGLDKQEMVNRLRDLHYGYIDWTLTTGDGGGPTFMSPEEFLHNVVDSSAKYPVISVLMHDYSTNTLKCLPEMIDILTEQGFIFLPLSYDAPIVRKGR